MQIVAQNVCVLVDTPKVRRSEAMELIDDEVGRLLAVAARTRWGPFVIVALATGCRRGEFLAMPAARCRPKKRTVTIHASLSQTKEGGVTLNCTKTDAVRTVPLSSIAFEALRTQLSTQAADKLRAGDCYIDNGFIFADELDCCISPIAATNAYARLARMHKYHRRDCITPGILSPRRS